MFTQAISPSFWGTVSDSYGRRPVLISSMIIYVLACIGLAFTPNYIALILLRILQSFGSSSVNGVGIGVIGDISDVSRLVCIIKRGCLVLLMST
jgi:MFS family permease